MNVLKKSVVGILIIAILATVFSINSLATVKGKVNTDTVRLRKEATTDSKIVTLLSMDDEVEVIEKTDDWYKVKYNNYEGFVSSKYITLENGAELDNNTATNLVNNQSQINGSDTNSSGGQSTEGEVNNSTNIGESNITDGQVAGENSQGADSSSESAVSVMNMDLPAKIVVKTDLDVYIVPVINSIAVQTIKANAEVVVNECINNWAYITTDVYSGWVIAEGLVQDTDTTSTSTSVQGEKDSSTSEQNEASNEVVTDKVAYINVESTINLREKASTTSKVVKILTRNTEVKIVGEDGDWYKITVGEDTGFVYKKYVSDTKLQATSRSLSSTRTAKAEATDTAKSSTTSTSSKTTSTTSKTNESAKVEEEPTTSVPANTSLGNQIVAFAKKYVGYKYVAGGASPSTGFDCSGFTSYVYKQFGISVSRSSVAQASNGKKISRADIQVGDLLIFQNSAKTRVGHVGIYIGGNNFIHAENSKTGVVITSLSKSYYSQRLVSIRRVF